MPTKLKQLMCHQSPALSIFWIVYFWVWVPKHPKNTQAFWNFKAWFLWGQILLRKFFSSSIWIKSYDLKAKLWTIQRYEQAIGKCKAMGDLVLPNTFPMPTKASLMWGKTPGINFWETTFSAAAAQEAVQHKWEPGASVMLFLGIPQTPTQKLRCRKRVPLQFKGSLAQNTWNHQSKKEENKPVSFLPRKRRMFTMTNPWFHIHSSNTSRSGNCSNLQQLQYSSYIGECLKS